MSKKSNKQQGKRASAKSKGGDNVNVQPRSLERGIGTEFAYAVSNLMDQAEETKGSTNGFLGVEKVTLSASEHAHSLLPKDFKPKEE